MTLTSIIFLLTKLVLAAVPVLVALALLFFFWGLAHFILTGAASDEGRKKGRDRMVWGLVALFFILSLGGLVAIVQNTFFKGLLNTSGGSLHTAPGGNANPPIVAEQRTDPFRFGTDHFCVFGRGLNCDSSDDLLRR